MNQSSFPIELPESRDMTKNQSAKLEQIRVKRPVRNQVEMTLRNLDSLIPEDHPVRAMWAFLQRLNLSDFYTSIKATLDSPGRPASDPQVLLALWVYATAEGIGSARRLDKLCQEHDAYRWLCGGVPVDYHTLSDFRVAHLEGTG